MKPHVQPIFVPDDDDGEPESADGVPCFKSEYVTLTCV